MEGEKEFVVMKDSHYHTLYGTSIQTGVYCVFKGTQKSLVKFCKAKNKKSKTRTYYPKNVKVVKEGDLNDMHEEIKKGKVK